MNYSIEKKGLDEYELKYTNTKDEEVIIPFKRDIEVKKQFESINSTARIRMFKTMSEAGITKDDLVVKRKDGSNIIYDETNYKEYEKKFMQEAQLEIINNIYKHCFGKGLAELILDFKDANEKNIFKLSAEITTVLLGNDTATPSEEAQQ